MLKEKIREADVQKRSWNKISDRKCEKTTGLVRDDDESTIKLNWHCSVFSTLYCQKSLKKPNTRSNEQEGFWRMGVRSVMES